MNPYIGTVKCITCHRALVHDIDKLARDLTQKEFESIAFVDQVCDFCNKFLSGQCRICYDAEGDARVRIQFDNINIEHLKEYHDSVNLT